MLEHSGVTAGQADQSVVPQLPGRSRQVAPDVVAHAPSVPAREVHRPEWVLLGGGPLAEHATGPLHHQLVRRTGADESEKVAGWPIPAVAEVGIDQGGLPVPILRLLPLVEDQDHILLREPAEEGDEVAGLLVGQRRELEAPGLQAPGGSSQTTEQVFDAQSDRNVEPSLGGLLQDLPDCLSGPPHERAAVAFQQALTLLLEGSGGEPAGVRVGDGAEGVSVRPPGHSKYPTR